MRLFRLLGLLIVLCVVPSLWATEIARWEAGKGSMAGGVTLVNAAGSKWTLAQQHKFQVAAIEPTHDYYTRAEFFAKISKTTSFPIWLELEYLDEGYGLISVGPAGKRGCATSPGRMSGGWQGLIPAAFAARLFALMALLPIPHRVLIPKERWTSYPRH